MTSTLCILSCHNFQPEISAAIAAEGWGDVVAPAFPVRCGRPPVSWAELRPLLPEYCTQVVLLGRACLNNLGEPPAGFPPVRIEHQAQCFHLVAGQHLVDEAITEGAYLITPIWLANWRIQIKKLGFEVAQAGDFFCDFASELVLLDTGIDPESTRHLAELQAAVKLPARRIAVGLDHVRLLISRLVLTWRLEESQRQLQQQSRHHAAELADHVAATDMLTRLANTHTESEAIASIEELFQMLFAPAALHYLRLENDVPVPCGNIAEVMQEALKTLSAEYAWTPDEQGFLLQIRHGEEILGLIAVDRLAFPVYRERYLNMALAVAGVCGLAIENARNRRRLQEAAKMASLGIMVAGVAHEINTPLGVGLAAASTLQEHARHLAEQFAARSMTQSDLTRYLELAATSTGLLRQNLERIAHLINAFRQVAVAGKPLTTQRFKLRACLDEVISSLGERLSGGLVTMNIDCDPMIEIDGVFSDWVSIFVNLLSNSLRHGFMGRARGNIGIQLTRDAKHRLRIDYQDDGKGMTPEAQARIFDPFFTTDLQQGMGLGMHLVYNLITHRMGGTILCESAPGKGTRFHILVPLEQAETLPKAVVS